MCEEVYIDECHGKTRAKESDWTVLFELLSPTTLVLVTVITLVDMADPNYPDWDQIQGALEPTNLDQGKMKIGMLAPFDHASRRPPPPGPVRIDVPLQFAMHQPYVALAKSDCHNEKKFKYEFDSIWRFRSGAKNGHLLLKQAADQNDQFCVVGFYDVTEKDRYNQDLTLLRKKWMGCHPELYEDFFT